MNKRLLNLITVFIILIACLSVLFACSDRGGNGSSACPVCENAPQNCECHICASCGVVCGLHICGECEVTCELHICAVCEITCVLHICASCEITCDLHICPVCAPVCKFHICPICGVSCNLPICTNENLADTLSYIGEYFGEVGNLTGAYCYDGAFHFTYTGVSKNAVLDFSYEIGGFEAMDADGFTEETIGFDAELAFAFVSSDFEIYIVFGYGNLYIAVRDNGSNGEISELDFNGAIEFTTNFWDGKAHEIDYISNGDWCKIEYQAVTSDSFYDFRCRLITEFGFDFSPEHSGEDIGAIDSLQITLTYVESELTVLIERFI